MRKVMLSLIVAKLIVMCVTTTLFGASNSLSSTCNNDNLFIEAVDIFEIDSAEMTKNNTIKIDKIDIANRIVSLENRKSEDTIKSFAIYFMNVSNDSVELTHFLIKPFSVRITRIDSLAEKIGPLQSFGMVLSFILPKTKDWRIDIQLKTSETQPNPIQNPVFSIVGTVRTPYLSLSGSQTKYFAHFSGLKSNCNKPISIILKNEGEETAQIDSITTQGNDSSNFQVIKTFTRNIKAGEETIIEIIPNPLGVTKREYTTNLVIYSNAVNDIYTQEIAFTATYPRLLIPEDTSLLQIDTLVHRIPISFQFSDEYSLSNIAFRLGLQIPWKSRFSIRPKDSGFIINPKIPGLYKVDTFTNNGFFVLNIQKNDTNPGLIKDNLLGHFQFEYFLSEEAESIVDITYFELINEYEATGLPPYCKSLSMNSPSKIIIKRKDSCLEESLQSFMAHVRNKTGFFGAKMEVSGEPVLEIQHYIKDPTFAQISLYSVNGMKLETVFSGMASAELHQFRHPMSHLPPGVYFCEMLAGQFHKTIPIILNR